MSTYKINKDDLVDTDGVDYEDYSATLDGQYCIVRVPIERKEGREVNIKRYWSMATPQSLAKYTY